MSRSFRTPTPLRRSLFLRFALLVTGAMALFAAGYLQFGLRPVVDRVAESHFNAAAGNVVATLHQLFDPAETLLGVARIWATSGHFNEDSPEEFNRLARPMLEQSPQFTSIVAGSDDGRGWMLLALPDGAWMNRFTNIPLRGKEQIFIDWNADGSHRTRREEVEYDARTRPWYEGAIGSTEAGQVFWTDPYIFFTTRDPGITASTRTPSPDGGTLVLGIDIKLLDVSRAASGVEVSKHGLAMVLTDEALLLGIPRAAEAPDDERVRSLVLQPVSAIGNPALTAGVQQWIAERRPQDRVLRFSVAGVNWLASFREFRRGRQVFWVSVLAPESDFVPAWQPMAQALLGISALVLMLSFLYALRYTRRFSEPLESLAAESARIARLEFQDGPPIHSSIAEIQQLAGAQETMRDMLNAYRHNAEAQSENLMRQIAALRSAESKMEHLSQHDPLTGLPNRLLLSDRLAHAVKLAERRGARLAVLFLDLDGFKAVNDSQGHPVGDQLLCIVATRLASTLRDSDTLARVGGDEFVLLAEDIGDELDARAVADKVLDALVAPFEIDGRSFHLSGSVGISIYPDDAVEPVVLIRNADSAMYEAKSRASNSYCFYAEEMTLKLVARMQLEESLHLAIERGEFELHYQPQLDMRTRQVLGMEALVRWRHTQRGLVPPNEFIPLAEESGLICQIGEWVLDEACRQWAEWAQHGIVVPRVAVNLSAKQLQSGNFAAMIDSVLKRTGMPASVLELEMTESFFLESPDALGMLLQIGRTGVSLALDDFGTGYSSLGYLKKLPLARLKIDREFTSDIGKDADGEALVRAIISLAGALGREVIAEGVESVEQADFMLQHGCRQAQGYLYSKPLCAADFRVWWLAHQDSISLHRTP